MESASSSHQSIEALYKGGDETYGQEKWYSVSAVCNSLYRFYYGHLVVK
jgi:hypothetical protein